MLEPFEEEDEGAYQDVNDQYRERNARRKRGDSLEQKWQNDDCNSWENGRTHAHITEPFSPCCVTLEVAV